MIYRSQIYEWFKIKIFLHACKKKACRKTLDNPSEISLRYYYIFPRASRMKNNFMIIIFYAQVFMCFRVQNLIWFRCQVGKLEYKHRLNDISKVTKTTQWGKPRFLYITELRFIYAYNNKIFDIVNGTNCRGPKSDGQRAS